MNIFRINTTAFGEEDFTIMTTLSAGQISEVLQPIVDAERDGHDEYDNVSLVSALRERFPLDAIETRVDIQTLIF
jgi:hypothetical protein